MVVVLVLILIVIIVVMVMMVMVVMALLTLLVVMSALRADTCGFKQLLFEIGMLLHSLKDSLTRDLIPGSRNENSLVIVLTDQLNCLFELCVAAILGAAEDYSLCVLDLVVEELTEVLHVHLALNCVNYRDEVIYGDACLLGNIRDGLDNVRELAYARRLDDDAVGFELLHNLYKRPAEIADQGAADAARIHLGDLDAAVL